MINEMSKTNNSILKAWHISLFLIICIVLITNTVFINPLVNYFFIFSIVIININIESKYYYNKSCGNIFILVLLLLINIIYLNCHFASIVMFSDLGKMLILLLILMSFIIRHYENIIYKYSYIKRNVFIISLFVLIVIIYMNLYDVLFAIISISSILFILLLALISFLALKNRKRFALRNMIFFRSLYLIFLIMLSLFVGRYYLGINNMNLKVFGENDISNIIPYEKIDIGDNILEYYYICRGVFNDKQILILTSKKFPIKKILFANTVYNYPNNFRNIRNNIKKNGHILKIKLFNNKGEEIIKEFNMKYIWIRVYCGCT